MEQRKREPALGVLDGTETFAHRVPSDKVERAHPALGGELPADHHGSTFILITALTHL